MKVEGLVTVEAEEETEHCIWNIVIHPSLPSNTDFGGVLII